MAMTEYKLSEYMPTLPSRMAAGASEEPSEQSVLALDIECKYQFVDDGGNVVHEYAIPGNADIHNCGGYIDKLLKYRDPKLAEYLQEHGVSESTLVTNEFPILATRSPELDLALLGFIDFLLDRHGQKRVSLLDHGCTVAEHYDLLGLMIRATRGCGAEDVLDYYGLDVSPLVLSAARMLHSHAPRAHFKLMLAEGSQFDLEADSVDLSLTVGVVNHVADPQLALDKLLTVSKHAAVMALWVTDRDKGFWVLNHSGVGTYFFSRDDLRKVLENHPEGRFLAAKFVAETDSSQPCSYMGIGEAEINSIGCYHLIYTTMDDAPLPYSELVL